MGINSNSSVTIEAKDVWAYFNRHKTELIKMMHQIARNEDCEVDIFITEKSGTPCVVVTHADYELYQERCLNPDDCYRTIQRVYNEYLDDSVINKIMQFYVDDDEEKDLEELSKLEIEDMISERETELDEAIVDFLTIVLEGYIDEESTDLDDICDDLKEHFLEYIARKHDLPIRRPMYIEFEDGSEECEEYPYSCLIYDDPDNPIYKK